MSTFELTLNSLPYLDGKWLRANLVGALQSAENMATLYNSLVQSCELFTSDQPSVINCWGNLSYMSSNGKHYCGVQKLLCPCCTGYCRPNSDDCNCFACRQADETTKKITNATNANNSSSMTSADSIFDSWLWSPVPSKFFFSFQYILLLFVK